MLMLGLTHIALTFKKELRIIPGPLVSKESSSSPLIDSDKLWSHAHFVIVKVKL